MILQGNVFSQSLGTDTGISIITPWLPKDESDYNVAYLLHGIGGNNAYWTNFTMLPFYALGCRTIFVMPDGSKSFYSDMINGDKYFTYITEELPKICKSYFNISARRENTAIIGNSMGGYGALKCALSKPEIYGMCGSVSAACLYLNDTLKALRENEESDEYEMNFKKEFSLIFGDNLDFEEKNDLITLAKNLTEIKPRIFMRCGKDDMFIKNNRTFSDEIEKLGFDSSFEEGEGGHDLPFFDKSIKKIIEKFSL